MRWLQRRFGRYIRRPYTGEVVPPGTRTGPAGPVELHVTPAARHTEHLRHRSRKRTPVRTYTPKPGEVDRTWHVIDATDVVLGRLASQTAVLLRGKHKPTFAPHVDTGDFVIVVNADKVV